jgi:cellobiose-specific phosphotransferase system component IIA
MLQNITITDLPNGHVKQVQLLIRTAHGQKTRVCSTLLHACDGGLEGVQESPAAMLVSP